MSPKSAPETMVDKANVLAETSPSGSPSGKTNPGKYPKRIRKAEREKMKRENLNELFIALANALAVSEANSGKASILGETIRGIRDMVAELKCLRKENATLLAESHYVTLETKELKDENSALQTQIEELQAELKKRVPDSKLNLNITPLESQSQFLASHMTNDHPAMPAVGPGFQQGQVINPIYVIPICPELQVNQKIDATQLSSKPTPTISKPLPRYPTALDKWPSQLLEKHPESGKISQCSGVNE